MTDATQLPKEERFVRPAALWFTHDPNDGPFIVAEANDRLLTVMDCDLTIQQAREFRDWLNEVLSP